MNTKTFLIALLLSGAELAAAEKTFVYCSEGSPTTFNPQLASDGVTFNASAQMIYNRLVDFKTGSTELEPSLAKSWETSKDGLVYTFKLRPGVKFHSRGDYTPKRDFNADDVLFTYQRMLDPKHPFHKVGGGSYEYFKSMGLDQLIKSVEKVDDLTVRFILNRPEAPFLADLGMNFASILSDEYAKWLVAKKTPEKLDIEPVGTGPFVWKSYNKDTMIRYQAFAPYFGGKAKLDNVVFSITPDPSVRAQRLKTGECHFIAEPSPQNIPDLQKNSQVQVLSGPGFNVGYLAMNTQKPPLDNKDVRLAINLALNRKSYIDAIYLGQAQLAKNPMPPTLWGYNKNVIDHAYNPAKAKELLKKSGHGAGLDIQLWTLPVSRPYNPNGKKMGEMMQADLAKVGIRAILVTYDWGTYLSKAKAGEHQLIQVGWTGDNGDPDNFLNTLLSCDAVNGGSNFSRWCYEPFDSLVSQARRELKQSKRASLYAKAQSIFSQELPWVPLVHSTVFKAMSKKVVGYKVHPLGTEDFYSVDLK